MELKSYYINSPDREHKIGIKEVQGGEIHPDYSPPKNTFGVGKPHSNCENILQQSIPLDMYIWNLVLFDYYFNQSSGKSKLFINF